MPDDGQLGMRTRIGHATAIVHATERVTVTKPRSPTIADAKNARLIAFHVRREARGGHSASSKSWQTHTRQSRLLLP